MVNTWQQMRGWELVLPPSRPDVFDLRRITEHARHVDRNAQVAVLGSTPEFRDLLHELGFGQIYILEKNSEFHESMTASRIYRNPERLIEGDWLHTLPGLSERFMMILSDLTSGNVSWDDRSDFYSGISGALARGGLFIDKILSNPAGLLSLAELEDRYRDAPPNVLTFNYFSCEAVFCSELQMEREVVDTTRIYDRLSSVLGTPRLRRLVAGSQLITPTNCLWYYGKSWSELAPEYCPKLDLLARYDLNPAQPYFGRAHQYVWRRPEVDP